MDYLSIVCLYRNDAPYLKEWIEFHKLVGVDRFYLYNNGSTDDHLDVLDPYIKNKDVIYYEYNVKTRRLKDWEHLGQVEHFFDKYKNKTFWAIVLDVDEFLFPVKHFKLPRVLRSYEEYDGIYVYWKSFNSSGHVEEPKGLVIENYDTLYDSWKSNWGKTIFQPSKCFEYKHRDWKQSRRTINAHLPAIKSIVDENKHKLNIDFGDYKKCPIHPKNLKTNNILTINHYYFKSREYFINRKTRDSIKHPKVLARVKKRMTEEWNKCNLKGSKDNEIKKYIKELKKRMK